MTSKLTFYQCEITPEKNCVVDDITGYLSSLTPLVVDNFQYIKLDLDLYIKINSSQTNVANFNYNYVAVKNSDVSKVYYYFIIGSPKWISQNTIQLQLSLDTLNTYWTDLQFTDKTHITRQHKDRFIKKTSTNLLRKVDKFEEGITGTKFFKAGTSLRVSSADYDWYLIYKNKVDVNTNTSVPIDCFCCASENITLKLPTSENGINFDNYNVGDSISIYSKDNNSFTWTVNGSSYTISADGTYKGLLLIKRQFANVGYLLKSDGNVLVSNIGNTTLTGITSTLKGYYAAGYDPIELGQAENYSSAIGNLELHNYTELLIGGTSGTLSSISTVNRSDTKIIKIIKMPYAPFDVNIVSGKMTIPTGWIYSGGYLKLEDFNTEFLSYVDGGFELDELQLAYNSGDLAANKNHDIKYESKLYNSNFYSVKYAYDNFEKEILLERFTARNDFPGNVIKFKQSNNISSNSLFDIQAVNGTYEEPTLYGRFLNVNRQNELALFSSDYINYIRTGYNYDKKAKERQLTSNIIGLGISAAGSVAGFAASAVTGGVSTAAAIGTTQSLISGISNTIFQAISAEDAINQKLEATKQSPASVSNTEDLNLLSYYNGNRLIHYTESVSDEVKNSIYTLFRLTGYACNDYGVPVTNSRLYYNFLQCDADIEESSWTAGTDFLDDVKSRLKAGVTIFHKVNGSYNFLQDKENFETWLIT